MAAIDTDPRLLGTGTGFRAYGENMIRRVRGGELGSLPVILGLIIIWSVFDAKNSRFLSADNLSNLLLQVASTGTIAIGVVFVLLLGEVDLSVGSVSGVAAAVLAVLNVKQGLNPWLSILLALVAGAAIGALQGGISTRFQIPPFVVTLAGLIAWQGLQLKILGDTGTINFTFNGAVSKLSTTVVVPFAAWILAAVTIAVYLLSQLYEVRTRTKAGLRGRPIVEIVVRSIVIAAALIAAVAILNNQSVRPGIPISVLIFVGLVVVMDLLIKRTTYGRHVLAVGGNEEAARRAGLNVSMIKITVFLLAGAFAALGGVLDASRAIAAGQSTGGGDVLLNAIAAAVIGGTSLFGGRGSAYSALLGILVIGSISNGMDLPPTVGAGTKFMITGGVLLAAVLVDALARRGRRAHGRA